MSVTRNPAAPPSQPRLHPHPSRGSSGTGHGAAPKPLCLLPHRGSAQGWSLATHPSDPHSPKVTTARPDNATNIPMVRGESGEMRGPRTPSIPRDTAERSREQLFLHLSRVFPKRTVQKSTPRVQRVTPGCALSPNRCSPPARDCPVLSLSCPAAHPAKGHLAEHGTGGKPPPHPTRATCSRPAAGAAIPRCQENPEPPPLPPPRARCHPSLGVKQTGRSTSFWWDAERRAVIAAACHPTAQCHIPECHSHRLTF